MLSFWEAFRLVGWTFLFLRFALDIVEMRTEKTIFGDRTDLFQLIGAIGVFLVAFGYLMVHI